MIGRLWGRIVEKRPPYLLLNVNGVGYELEAPMTTFYNLSESVEEIALYTHLVVRDDAHLLFGFSTETERRLFRTLLKVNGVGAKLALTILSGSSVDEFVTCINNGDSVRLTRLPGVGKKTAERLIVEMRDRLADWERDNALPDAAANTSLQGNDATADAVAGLIALGYKPQDASRNVHAVSTDGLSTEDIIRLALKGAMK